MGKRQQLYEKILYKYFKYETLKREQFYIIDNIIHKKNDVCAILATGYGKSLCYQLPFLITNKSVIIISPLLALMTDQYNYLKEMNIPVCCLNSNNSNKFNDINDILAGNNKIIFMTPEYFVFSQDFLTQLYESKNLLCVAIDESHCISTWSDNSFRPEYKQLKLIREWLPKTPILTLTATANNKIIDDITSTLQLKKPKIVKGSFDRKNLYISVEEKNKIIKYSEILELVKKYNDEFIIIYSRTKKETEEISNYLNKNRCSSNYYHAGITKERRDKIQTKFMSGECKIIVATIAFGMGINNRSVRLVIHYGCPKNLDSYYQEIGRAGRDDKESFCHMFYSKKDFYVNKHFIDKLENETFKGYCFDQLYIIEQFCYSDDKCRRKIILNHFEEEYDVKCNKCNNCCSKKKKKNTQNLTNETNLIIQLIKSLRYNFGASKLIKILKGSKSKDIKFWMEKLPTYGKGSKYPEKWWKEFVDILERNNYLKIIRKLNIKGGLYDIDLKGNEKLIDIILPISKYMEKYKPIDSLKITAENFAQLDLNFI